MQNDCQETITVQGVECPACPPWSWWSSLMTGIPLVILATVGTRILYLTSRKVLIFWLACFFMLTFPLRWLVCTRCPYCDKNCYLPYINFMATHMPFIFKKQPGKSMLTGLWLDVAVIIPIFLLPFPYAYRLKGWRLSALWAGVISLTFAAHTKAACSLCPFTFCPIGKAGRAFWGKFTRRREYVG